MDADKQLYATLNTGAKMPLLAFGTLMETITPDQRYVSRVVTDALDAGYRHLDTARIYGNEQGVGAALRAAFTAGTIKRDDVFVTTKLWRNSFAPEDVVPALKQQLSDLDLEYVDLYLVHWPTAFKSGKELIPQDKDGNQIIAAIDYLDTWKGMEECYELGITKAIGLSNFNSVQLQRVLDNCRIKPANLQIESHPYLTNSKLVRYCEERGVTVTAYSPLGGPRKENQPSIFSDPTIGEIARRHEATAAQVALRFQLQRNVCVAPKSSKKHRMEENLKALDIDLTDDEMEILEKCNKNLRLNAELKHHPFYPFNRVLTGSGSDNNQTGCFETKGFIF